MKNFFRYSILSTISFLIISCSRSIKGEGEIINKEIKISQIKEISAHGSYRLIYLYDIYSPRIVIESYKNLIENLKIEDSNGKLSISESRKVSNPDLYNIYLYNKQIEKFDIHDNVHVDINTQLRVSKLTINLYDTTKFIANTVIANDINVQLKNDAKINLRGSSNNLTLLAHDSSDFTSPFLELSEAQVELSDVANAELAVKSKLQGKISDNTKLTVIGNPAKNIQQKDLAVINFK